MKYLDENNLWKNFLNIVSWVTYAEKKNTLILTSNAILLSLVAFLFKLFDTKIFIVNSNLKYYVLVLFVLILISTALVLLSFFPVSKLTSACIVNNNDELKPENANLFFYGHIAMLSNKQIEEELLSRDGESSLAQSQKDVIAQIKINSNIANNKYELFKIAFKFLALELLLFIVILILSGSMV